MVVFNKAVELSKELDNLRSKGYKIGFVPTMGALHPGHISLVKQACDECEVVVVSIFVNPTQFNNPDDLKKYPRTLERDLEMLKQTLAKFVFYPSVEEIYPSENTKKIKFNFGGLADVMEGKYRPSHFDGVAMVVKRLFEIVKPDKAYFGQKDIQQFLIINYLNNNYLKDLNIELVKCPIIREHDGLAMSSRNVLLNEEQRNSAALISQTLFEYQKKYKSYSVENLRQQVIEKINQDENLEVEYFEIVNDPDLKLITNWDEANKILACIAVFAGKVRLIDNIYFN